MSDTCVRTSDALRLVAEKIECIKPKQIKDIAWCIATLENAASQMDSTSDEIYELRQQLSASQRRERAAVELIGKVSQAVEVAFNATDYVKPNTGIWHTLGLALDWIKAWRGPMAGEGDNNGNVR